MSIKDVRRSGATNKPTGRNGRARRWLGWLGVLSLSTAGLVGGTAPPATAACAANPVVCENARAGATDWDINGAGDDTIQGFATAISVNVGQQIAFKISTPARSYTIDIYRLGWYGGAGARYVAPVTPSARLPQSQPASCVSDPTTELYDCGNWAVSATWIVPADAVSGIYLARLKRTDVDNGEASHITFVVRDDASSSALLFKTSDATWQAYNTYGGSDFYQGAANGRAYRVSYNRPFATRGENGGRDFLFSNEYPMLRFLERNGYDISYTTDVDTDRRGDLIRNHRVFLSVGHDEYWSGPERANVEAARDAGVHLAFFSGNEVYWRTRLAPSADGTDTADRTLVCYKETWANDKIDPSTEWTGTWRDPRFTPPAVGGGNPENALTGTAYVSNHDDLAIQVPQQQGRNRLWRNTTVATLGTGQTATLAPHTVGYESDEDLDNGFRPAGLIRLSTTTGSTPEYLRDFGNTVTPGTTTHHLTLYRAASGALVFSAGTIQWSWGLDSEHDGTSTTPDVRMQQAVINLLADMDAQPATRMTGLAAAAKSTDTSPPTATVTSPATGTTVANGAQVTVQGTATDAGGGQVAGVEVSTDNGATWHAANGTTAWTYSFYTGGVGGQSVRVRAMDDSANIQPTPATVSLTLTGPSTIFGARVPATPAVNDSAALELGVRFTPQDAGYVTGIRFYKGTGNTGTHTGTLWTSTGAPLATGTFVGETSTGWQKLTFTNPVQVTAGTSYVASYTAPKGHYAADGLAFSAAAFGTSPLRADRSTETAKNGLYQYGSGFPTESYQDSNYYVDVLFVDSETGPPAPVALSPPAGAGTVPVAARPAVTFSKPLNPGSIQFTLRNQANVVVPGAVGYDDASRTVTFSPVSPLTVATTYTATVTAADTLGRPTEAPVTWSFTTDAYAAIYTLFAANATPQVAAANDFSSAELGVRFTPSAAGLVVGVRFYQGPGNTGTHTGSLWSAGGTLLARATFSGETGSGWQTVRFTTPVTVTAGTTYVASYLAPNGQYAETPNFFASPWTNGPLTAPATTNGVYRYGGQGFPTNSYRATNYWVDPLYVPR
ncbi:N,N-dimethylformamidase beta subunit family domain-containing protein [Micromonospora zhanjiangensis]|uniref:N,N-dimethylformamidase beta subunit family domain-containing protein n=1 Tax=Micromonospora zhanjiangensis TaxID=1522057 RepID=A0ABV8KLP2_9ACTN